MGDWAPLERGRKKKNSPKLSKSKNGSRAWRASLELRASQGGGAQGACAPHEILGEIRRSKGGGRAGGGWRTDMSRKLRIAQLRKITPVPQPRGRFCTDCALLRMARHTARSPLVRCMNKCADHQMRQKKRSPLVRCMNECSLERRDRTSSYRPSLDALGWGE